MGRKVLPVALAALGVVWVALLVLAPFAPRQTVLVYEFAGRICHQRPERSFHLAGTPLPVCARCFGLYASGTVAAVTALVLAAGKGVRGWRHARLVFAAASAPTVVTLAVEQFGLASPSNAARALASLPLGAAAGWLFVRMLLVEARAPARTAGPGGRVGYDA